METESTPAIKPCVGQIWKTTDHDLMGLCYVAMINQDGKMYAYFPREGVMLIMDLEDFTERVD